LAIYLFSLMHFTCSYKFIRKATILVLLFVLSASLAKAIQNVQFFDYSNGLSNEKITAICKDRNGLMWIGTEGGMSQFNGYEFIEIGYFKNHSIRSVLYDTIQNILWVGSNKGLFLFNIETHSIVHATAKIETAEVAEIAVFGEQKIVVFRNGEVMRFLPSGEVDLIFRLGKSERGVIGSTAFDGLGYLYLLLRDESTTLISINLQDKKYAKLKLSKEEDIVSIRSANGYCIVNWGNQKVGLYSYPKGLRLLDIPDAQSDDPLRVIQKIGDVFYFSYRESYGKYHLDEKTDKWDILERSALNRMLKSKNIRLFYVDKENVLWIGTTKGIVKVFADKKYPFRRILSQPDKTVSVRQIIPAGPNRLFIATYDGIYDYNRLTGDHKLLSNTPKDVGFPLYARTLLFDHGKYLYAGTESNQNYFFRFNIETQQFETRYFIEQNSANHINSVFSMAQDKNGVIWLATDIGLASFDAKSNQLVVHRDDRYSVGIKRLMYITAIGNGEQLLVCGKGGAYLIDIQKGLQVSYDATERIGTQDVEYLCATIDHQEKVWFGTLKHGVITCSRNGENVQVINQSNGLASDEVYAIIWQGTEMGWMSTAKGLCRYNLQNKSFQNYFYENGIADDEFNQHSFYKESDTLLYFGGINGITYFNPQQFLTEKNIVGIFLANITRWGTENTNKQVSFNDKGIVMNPGDYLITLNFGLNDFTHAEDNTFYYKINNINKDWISLGTENSLTLNGLAPGNYQIIIKGINYYGLQSTNMLAFSLIVREQFYTTYWFFILLTILVISAVYYYFRWRLNRITHRQLLRTQISSNLHDEVGSLLTQIVIATEGAIYATKTIEEKNKRLSKIASLSRNAINTMSDVLWSIDSRNDFVGNLTDRMREHAEMMFALSDVDLEFEFTDTRVSKTMDSQIRQHVYLIFKESIHNIIKHSEADKVKVTYKQIGQKIELIVANNNHHLAPNEVKMVGQGIRNMNMRAKKIGAVCTIDILCDWYTVSVKKV
jgi:hypothetical protein